MNDELSHYGVLGMKWGVRKDNAPQGTPGWDYTKKKRSRAAKVKGALQGAAISASAVLGAKAGYKIGRVFTKETLTASMYGSIPASIISSSAAATTVRYMNRKSQQRNVDKMMREGATRNQAEKQSARETELKQLSSIGATVSASLLVGAGGVGLNQLGRFITK